ncbi:DUF7857 domain-containing protein [Haloarchaeobius salinus]|uniref:DUF7857 domain-containing protein n=1 Tax=Haloarchaeobius salinus TaxID=1198298 RepID=UPI00210C9096|nr:hypothetical protein [Haloarchaeobius salinus]
MVELDVETERRDCVTFVAATVQNASDVARRVTLRTDCRPLWPPRRQGVPAAGWDEGGVTLTVPAGRTTGVGFATPVAPDEPVLAVQETVPVAGEEAHTEPTPEHVVRALGDPTPPADAVPVAAENETATAEGGRR